MKWKAIGYGGCCPNCGKITQVESDPNGVTRERCYVCFRTVPYAKPALGGDDAREAESGQPGTRDYHVRPRNKRKRKARPPRPCPNGDRCIGTGVMPSRRGRPSPAGCDPCIAGRVAVRA